VGRRRQSDDETDPPPAPPSADHVRVEWSTCASSRRLLITLSEAEVPLDPLVSDVKRAAARYLATRAERRKLEARLDLTDNPYEQIVDYVVKAIGPDGELVACRAIRARYPEPPVVLKDDGTVDRPISGVLIGASKFANMSPRSMPSKLVGLGGMQAGRRGRKEDGGRS